MSIRQKTIGLFWFANDLRLHDNPALMRANSLVDELLCVYVLDQPWRTSGQYYFSGEGEHAKRFLHDSLQDLQLQLNELDQDLLVVRGNSSTVIASLLQDVGVTDVFRSETAGWYENHSWQALQESQTNVCFHSVDSHTLFDRDQLPFLVNDLPASFSQFKKAVADCQPAKPLARITSLPPQPAVRLPQSGGFDVPSSNLSSVLFQGGERAGLTHLQSYFSTDKPSYYKEVRNAIDGWDNSCKLSPWLANGCLSVREVAACLSEYETTQVANESTYWIYFELLWREFFQWYAHKHGHRLFAFSGIKRRSLLTSFYAERFQKWINGNTPYPIVNACMNELKHTGYLSNRGRQIVASCLVNELSIDWRYGAAYFEQMLVDYDVAANWGNWQYLAGVGADVKSQRRFNLEKQAKQFDPDQRYIRLWGADTVPPSMDSLDAADWPIA